MIDFGPWSTTLAFGMGFGLAVALLLLATRRNRAAKNGVRFTLCPSMNFRMAAARLGASPRWRRW